ncbi:MAG: HDIG domain-containing protein [Anaerolineae bacterium]|nr:HDIG domain-containing protein [Anaerolineae bacterium]
MTREEALGLVKSLIKNKNLVKHNLATEACMRALARHFGEDEETWALVGLLHDADYEITEKDPERHTLELGKILREKDVDETVIRAAQSHSDASGVPRNTLMAKALYACDELTGLIVAAALVHPDKKLAPLDVEFIMRRFKEKAFARGAHREQILTCEPELGIELEEFISISLSAMQGIADELGL